MFPETPADMLGALLGGCVDGTLQLSESEGEAESLEVEEVMEPVVEDESCLRWGPPLMASLSSLSNLCMSSRLLRVWPGCFA